MFITEVEVIIENGSKHAVLHQKLFVNKVRKVSWCYSTEFSNEEIVSDLNKSSKFIDETFVLKQPKELL